MQLRQMERNIEAILFASGAPLEIQKLAHTLDSDDKTVLGAVESIRARYQTQQSPFDIVRLGGALQMCTLPQYGDVIRSALEQSRNTPLSQAALEVLAVIAYNQPVTRSFVEQVRGVDCSSIIRSLVDKCLVEEAGRLAIPGKPISYQTTANFLRCFGLESLSQLPTLPDLPAQPEDGETAPQLDGQIDFFGD